MSEVNALKTLRETTLAHLSQSDYENILKAVEVGGIDSLTGTASMIVKSAVLKHGSHDQSSHNPKKGGGGGGGGTGGGGDTTSPTALGDTHKQELETAERNVRDAANKGLKNSGTADDPYIGPPTKAAKKAADYISAARGAKTIEDSKYHTDKAKGLLTQAFEQYENENYHDAAKVMFDTSKNLTSIMSAATRGIAITPFGD